MPEVGNWIGEITTTIGTGDIELGGPIDGFAQFSNLGGNGTQVWYSVVDGTNREAGIGTLQDGNIQRTTVSATLVDGVYSDNAPAPLELSGGAEVYCSFNKTAFEEFDAKIGPEGGTFTGPVNGIEPIVPGNFATKNYVDTAVATTAITDFDPAAVYATGDIVVYNGSIYKANKPTGPTFISADWNKMDAEGLQAQLDNKADAIHGHVLGDLDQSGATDGQIVAWDQLAESWVPVDPSANAVLWGGITGTLSNQTDLQAALDAKANSVHTHVIADVTGLQTELDGKATAVHTHVIADVTGLQTALDGKAAVSHTHDLTDLNQSGALEGQVVTWNNTAGQWEPQTPTGGGAANAVVTDPTVTQTIDQTVNGAIPLTIDASGTSTVNAFEVSQDTVKKSHITPAGRAFFDDGITCGADSASSSWDNYFFTDDAVKLGPSDGTVLVQFNPTGAAAHGDTGAVIRADVGANVTSPANANIFLGVQGASTKVFQVKGDGTGFFAGPVGVQAATDTDQALTIEQNLNSSNSMAIRATNNSSGAGLTNYGVYAKLNAAASSSGSAVVMSVAEGAGAEAAYLFRGYRVSDVSDRFTVKGDGSGYFAGNIGVNRQPRGSWSIASERTIPDGGVAGVAYLEDLSTTAGAPNAAAGVLNLVTAANLTNAANKNLLVGTYNGGAATTITLKGDGSAYFSGRIGVGTNISATETITVAQTVQTGIYVNATNANRVGNRTTAFNCAYNNQSASQAVGYLAVGLSNTASEYVGFYCDQSSRGIPDSKISYFLARNDAGSDVSKVKGDGQAYFAGGVTSGADSANTSWQNYFFTNDSTKVQGSKGLILADLNPAATTAASHGTDGAVMRLGMSVAVTSNANANFILCKYGVNTQFRVQGDGTVTAAGDITAFSDRRLKENFSLISGALNKVDKLFGYTYDRKDMVGRHAGLVAQDVQAVLPEAVTEQDDEIGTLAINDAAVTGLLVEAIKELRAEVADLKLQLRAKS